MAIAAASVASHFWRSTNGVRPPNVVQGFEDSCADRCASARTHWRVLRHRERPDIVGRAIRPIAFDRKKALFARSDGGGENWSVAAARLETCKLYGAEPLACFDVLARIVNGHLATEIDERTQWAYAPPASIKGVV